LRDVTTIALAPSAIADALPAVTTPSLLNTGLRLASASGVVSRGHSSVSTTLGSPLRCGITTGTISSLNLPALMAAVARSWLW